MQVRTTIKNPSQQPLRMRDIDLIFDIHLPQRLVTRRAGATLSIRSHWRLPSTSNRVPAPTIRRRKAIRDSAVRATLSRIAIQTRQLVRRPQLQSMRRGQWVAQFCRSRQLTHINPHTAGRHITALTRTRQGRSWRERPTSRHIVGNQA